MTHQPRPGPQQPWWLRPGGAPVRGVPPSSRPPQRQHVAPRPAAPRPKKTPKKTSRVVWVAPVLVIVVAVAVLVAALVYFDVFGGGTVLDVRQAEAGVERILSDPINGYGANDVTAVVCNNGRDPEVRQGNGFTCQVMVNGVRRQVQVVFRDDAGTYEVDGPR